MAKVCIGEFGHDALDGALGRRWERQFGLNRHILSIRRTTQLWRTPVFWWSCGCIDLIFDAWQTVETEATTPKDRYLRSTSSYFNGDPTSSM